MPKFWPIDRLLFATTLIVPAPDTKLFELTPNILAEPATLSKYAMSTFVDVSITAVRTSKAIPGTLPVELASVMCGMMQAWQ
jgi:hypothetical protein